MTSGHRLTQFAHGGGCACKIPPGELEEMVRGLTGAAHPSLVVGLDDGDDAAAVRIEGGLAVLATADFFTPVVDDAYDWGRIAAANALSDIYAMGGRPVVAVNLLGWPRDVLPRELAQEVLRGGLDVATQAGCPVAGGHSVDDPEPKYGMAVTGLGDPDRLLRNDAATAGVPISLTKPLGVGVLNNRHKATGEVFEHAVESMVAPQRGGLPGGPGCGRHRGHRRHRVRAAGPPVQDGPRLGRHRGGRRRRRALPRGGARVAARRVRPRRQQAQPRLGAAAPRAPTWTRTSCSCWPTRRPVAGCWSPARSRGRRSSASSCRRGDMPST